MSIAQDPWTPQRWRAHRWVACGLTGPSGGVAAATVIAEVGRLGCVQAQEIDMTVWALGQRTGLSRSEVIDALADEQLVRTHALRPTWHLVRLADLARVQAATAPRVKKLYLTYARQVGLDAQTQAQFSQWLEGALAAGPRTRAQIRSGAASAGFAFDTIALSIALMRAELDMQICSGPPHGLTQTYRMLEGRPDPDAEAATEWLVRTFLSSHGPSSVADLCAWSSLTTSAVRSVVADLGSDLESAEILGERRYWMGAVPAGETDGTIVELLNGYDEYISGLGPRSKEWLDPDRLYPGRVRTPIACLMVDGILAGHWRRTLTPGGVTVSVELNRTLTDLEAGELEKAAQRFGHFVGKPLRLEITGP